MKAMTYTGKQVDPFAIRADMICIHDIAHHLSQLCRFGGATQDFYSVAQHSVHVSVACPDELALWGLLHDAAEAYIGDIVRPVKERIPKFEALELRLLVRVSHAFKLEWPMPDEVIRADNAVLQWELERFEQGASIRGGMQPKPAKNLFMSQFKNLTGGGCPCGCGT